MNCLNSLLSKDGAAAKAIAKAGVGSRDTTRVGMGVPLSLIRAALANLSLPVGGEFWQKLRQAQGLTIGLDNKFKKITKSFLFFF